MVPFYGSEDLWDGDTFWRNWRGVLEQGETINRGWRCGALEKLGTVTFPACKQKKVKTNIA